MGAELKVSDYDWDGKPEARLRYRFPTGRNGDGEIRKVAIVNLDGPTPRIALKLVLSDNHPRFPVRQSAHFLFKDIDKDGRPEMVVTTSLSQNPSAKGNSKSAANAPVFRRHNKTPYRWAFQTDTWVLAASKDTLPPTMGFGFQGLAKDVGMTVGNLASGKTATACMDPECMDRWGFPAISRDGKHIVLLGEVPMWAGWSPAPGFELDHRGLSFELLRTTDGKLVKQVDILDSGIRSRAYTAAQDQSCLDEVHRTGQGDPRLCESDPSQEPAAMAGAKGDIKKRVAQAARAIWSMQFMPLLDDMFSCTKQPPPGKFLDLSQTKKGSVVEAKIVERPSGRVIGKHNFTIKHERVWELDAWVCPRHRVGVFRLVESDDPMSYAVHHAVIRLPRGYRLPDPIAPRPGAPRKPPPRKPPPARRRPVPRSR